MALRRSTTRVGYKPVNIYPNYQGRQILMSKDMTLLVGVTSVFL
jgi:hypothetical protein